MSFLKESIKEFDHVVWPTSAETSRYFSVVLSVIAVFAVFLFLVGTAFSTSLFAVRDAVLPPVAPTASAPSPSSASPDIDLGSLLGSGAAEVSTGSVAPVSGEAAAK